MFFCFQLMQKVFALLHPARRQNQGRASYLVDVSTAAIKTQASVLAGEAVPSVLLRYTRGTEKRVRQVCGTIIFLRRSLRQGTSSSRTKVAARRRSNIVSFTGVYIAQRVNGVWSRYALLNMTCWYLSHWLPVTGPQLHNAAPNQPCQRNKH